MSYSTFFDAHDFILMEAGVIEPLSRCTGVRLHPKLENALLIYEDAGCSALTSLYQGFIDVARQGGVPIAVCTPTWRANRERLESAPKIQDANGDAVRFLNRLRQKQTDWSPNIAIGGQAGCKNDCYKPGQGLSMKAARSFHAWQFNHLAEAGADFLLAATLPALEEAAGMALAMSETGLAYIISFVINRQGLVLDGSSLAGSISRIDDLCPRQPLGYMVNCAYPSFLNAPGQPPSVFSRLIGFQANASSLDHDQLDYAATRQADDLMDWGRGMVELHRDYGVKMLGGCCGTRSDHLRYLVEHIKSGQVQVASASTLAADHKRGNQ